MPTRVPRTIDLREFAEWLTEPVAAEDLLADLAPPKHFAHATFATYEVDPRHPSQRASVEEVRQFARSHRKSFFGNLFGGSDPVGGLYLDGGFGVGKTHLLASAYHAHHGRKSFLSFQELMFLVGLQRLEQTARTFSGNSLLVIDEFELDDPANTRIATNLLSQLLRSGVRVLTSSNTPPGALGEGKFSVDGFRRELGDLFAEFDVVRLDGEDYRRTHRNPADGSEARTSGWMPRGAIAACDAALVADFRSFLATLERAHPIRVRRSLTRLPAIHLEDVQPINDVHAALRFVYFIDKVYDDDIAFSASADISIDDVFAPQIYSGGDSKKLLRCLSRLVELTS